MSWLNPFNWGRKADENQASLDRLVAYSMMIQNTASGIAINPMTALHSPTVFAIVNRLAHAVGSTPFSIYENQSDENGRKVPKLPEHNTTRLLARKPNQLQTPYDYWSLATLRLLLWGRHVALKQRGGGRVASLLPIHPDHAEPEIQSSGRLTWKIRLPNGNIQNGVPADRIHHISYLNVDIAEPITPVQKCSETIAMEIAAEKFGATVFGSGAIPNGILMRDGHFKKPEDKKRFVESWNAAFRKKRGTALLEDGFKFEQIQMNNEESQFLETRKHQRSVIAGAWGFPPHLVGDLERATFSNIEHMSLDFVNFALGPVLKCISDAINRDLLTDAEVEAGRFARFDPSQLLRGDVKSRAEANQIKRQNGVINANEWREDEFMDAREDGGGNDYITPLNFRVEDEDGNVTPAPEGSSLALVTPIK